MVWHVADIMSLPAGHMLGKLKDMCRPMVTSVFYRARNDCYSCDAQ
jgi:hypothetical protein